METSPQILELSWGSIDTAGSFRDGKLWPGGGRNWDWDESGTDHGVGVQLADVAELLEHGAQVVVLGRGQERLSVPDDLVATVEAQGVDVEVVESRQAVERYNRLVADGRAVGALIHSTC